MLILSQFSCLGSWIRSLLLVHSKTIFIKLKNKAKISFILFILSETKFMKLKWPRCKTNWVLWQVLCFYVLLRHNWWSYTYTTFGICTVSCLNTCCKEPVKCAIITHLCFSYVEAWNWNLLEEWPSNT